MFLTRSDYDRGVNTFSPEGRLFQVEYATESIKLGSTVIGICTKQGVILAAEKRLASPLVQPDSVKKIVQVDNHLCAAFSGISADARTMVDHARETCQNHFFVYNEPMGVEACAQSVGDLALRFGRKGSQMSRPFGVALLLAGEDFRKGPVLYHVDPAGCFTQFSAKAIGSGGENAQKVLEERFKEDLTLEEGEKLALQILKDTMEEEISARNIDLALVQNSKYKKAKDSHVEEILPLLIDSNAPQL